MTRKEARKRNWEILQAKLDKYTYEEIGEVYNITRQRAWQICNKPIEYWEGKTKWGRPRKERVK